MMNDILVSEKIIDTLKSDMWFRMYVNHYESENEINIKLLSRLVEKYHKLLEVFYKVNIMMIGIKNIPCLNKLDDNTRDVNHQESKDLTLNDIQIVFDLIDINPILYEKTIRAIIENKLVPEEEIQLLEIIENN